MRRTDRAGRIRGGRGGDRGHAHRPRPRRRAQAGHALGRIALATPEVVEALAAALEDAGASLLREEALAALAALGAAARPAIPAIRARLVDPHRMVRLRAQGALAALLGEA